MPYANVHLFISILIMVGYIAVIGAAAYFVIRLAVTHALRSHTRWLERRPRVPEAPDQP